MLRAKVADTPSAVQQGLMFVRDLPQDEGMLFVFARAHNLSFWGMNTFIPLDIAFVDAEHVIRKIATIKAFSLDPVKSDEKCSIAIEANAGYFKANDILVGDKVEIDRGSYKDDAHISFAKTSKDSSQKQGNTKQSQVADVGGVPTSPQVGSVGVGQPMIPEPPQPEMQDQNLPTVGPSDIGKYLEDALEEENEQIGDGLDGNIDQPPEEQPSDETQEGFPVFSNIFEAAEWAEKNGEVVRINYTTKKGTALVRDVEPHGSFHSESTKRQILVTYDETVNAIRAFIATNVASWAFIGRKFQKKFVVKA